MFMKYLWTYLREDKIPNGNPSYHDLAFSSKLSMNIFIKKSSCNSTLSLCICLWNLNKWMLASLIFSYLNLGRYVSQYILGIQLGWSGMEAIFIGAYLAAQELILMKEKLNQLFKLFSSFYSGATIEHLSDWILWRWSLQVKEAWPSWCLTIVHHQ